MASRHEFPIAIFELPLVILPSEQIPLHIFEEQYKQMIADSLEREEPFGILFRSDDAVDTGCAASITDVLERFDDGRSNIIVRGEWRFRVIERIETEPWPAARVERVDDDASDGKPDPAAALRAFDALVEAVDGTPPPERPGSAFEIASKVELEPEVKQHLLEMRSEADRLDLVETSISDLADKATQARRLSTRASSNGAGRYQGPKPRG